MYQIAFLLLLAFTVSASPLEEQLLTALQSEPAADPSNEQKIPVAIETNSDKDLALEKEPKPLVPEEVKPSDEKPDLTGSETGWGWRGGWGGWRGGWGGYPGYYGGWGRSYYPRHYGGWHRSNYWG
ncbi:RNA-binding protein squid-like [Condylostylus longicornis]|uniref:RNA-binding protein squid-like n=1 Tax=Condylostylus longicornis TaxID=2530218 RepID=UPI00244DD926|nr:RNA-binding protein squid-like [Condylostylus longicornis]